MRIVNTVHRITALQKACCDGNDELVQHFLDEDLTDEHILRKDRCGETALHDAIKNGMSYDWFNLHFVRNLNRIFENWQENDYNNICRSPWEDIC